MFDGLGHFNALNGGFQTAKSNSRADALQMRQPLFVCIAKGECCVKQGKETFSKKDFASKGFLPQKGYLQQNL
jgi:hypothetical protein